MNQVTLLDTSIATRNVGDEIIMDSVRREIAQLVPEAIVRTVPSHERLGGRTRELLNQSRLNIAGGTNLVGPPMAYNRLWKIGPTEIIRSPRVTLMGVGWRRYHARVTPYSQLLLRRALSDRAPHAVRDAFTRDKLHALGVRNILVTGCPTTWQLTDEHVAGLPQEKGREAVIVLNGKKDPAGFAAELFRQALAAYEKVYFWPQMVPDMRYLSELPAGVTPVDPTLVAYDRILATPGIDYLGSRLHAGIRALQHSRRTFIFELDNRATEMGKTLGLPTFPARVDADYLRSLIADPLVPQIRIPIETVDEWRSAVRGVVLPG